MKWYTIKFQDSQQGTLVYHFGTKREARKQYNELKKESDEFNYVYGDTMTDAIDEHVVKTKMELVNWLNAHYAFDND